MIRGLVLAVLGSIWFCVASAAELAYTVLVLPPEVG